MGRQVKILSGKQLSELVHGQEYSKATYQEKNSRNDIPLN